MYHVASLNSIVYTYIYDSVIHLDLTQTELDLYRLSK